MKEPYDLSGLAQEARRNKWAFLISVLALILAFLSCAWGFAGFILGLIGIILSLIAMGILKI